MGSCRAKSSMVFNATSCMAARTHPKFRPFRNGPMRRTAPRVVGVAASRKAEPSNGASSADEESKGLWKTAATFLASVAAAQLVALPVPGAAMAGITNDVATDPIQRQAEDPLDQTSKLPSIGQVQKSVRQAQAVSNTTDDPKLQEEKGSPSNVVQGMQEVKDQVGKSGGLPNVGGAVKNILPDLSEAQDISFSVDAPNRSNKDTTVDSASRNFLGSMPRVNDLARDSEDPGRVGELKSQVADEAKFRIGLGEEKGSGDPVADRVSNTAKAIKDKYPENNALSDLSEASQGGYEGGNVGVPDPRNSELQSPVPTDTQNRDNRNLGPNEVGKDFIKSLPNASKADTAAPERAPTRQTTSASNPLPDLSEASQSGYEGGNVGVPDPRNSELESPVPTNTQNRDNRNLGPNEVGRDFIESLPYASNADTATPDRAPSGVGAGGPSSPGERANQVNKATDSVIGGAQGIADKIVGNQPKESTYSQKGGPWNWIFPKTLQIINNVLPDVSELPSDTASRDKKNLGPNEVSRNLLSGLPNATMEDTATPGRSGNVVSGAGQGIKEQVGRVSGPSSSPSSKLSGSSDPWRDLAEKAKNALPDLSELPTKDARNLGPNEIGKETLGGLPNASEIDQAAPGRSNSSGDFIGDRIVEATNKFAPKALKEGDDGATKAASDAIKDFLNISGK